MFPAEGQGQLTGFKATCNACLSLIHEHVMIDESIALVSDLLHHCFGVLLTLHAILQMCLLSTMNDTLFNVARLI